MVPIDPDGPFITSHSPSYERPRHEPAPPSPTGDPEVVALLRHLSAIEQEASQACRVGAERANDVALADELRLHAVAHDERSHTLARMVVLYGGAQEQHTTLLTHGTDAMARTSSDREVRAEKRDLHNELAVAFMDAARHVRVPMALRDELVRIAPPREPDTGRLPCV